MHYRDCVPNREGHGAFHDPSGGEKTRNPRDDEIRGSFRDFTPPRKLRPLNAWRAPHRGSARAFSKGNRTTQGWGTGALCASATPSGPRKVPYGDSMKNIWQGLAQELEDAKAAALYRSLRIAEPDSPALNFADNDYLGLRFHPRVVAAFQKAAEKYGTGSGASRLITGTTEIHERLEKKISVFKRREKALMYGSGYLANLGIVSALSGEKDLVIIDKLNHASIIDACRLSGAELRVYPHKNLKKLEAILKTSARFRRKLIITDSVFSMDGDLAPLPELVSIKKKSGALLMIDEAHGTGVFGENGRGAAEHFGVEEEIDISMGTLSKAVGCLGGYAAGSAVLIDYLINFSPPFIFATAPHPRPAGAPF